MKVKAIPADKVSVPPVRVSAVYDEGQMELLRESLKAMGTLQPIIVVATDSGYEIVDGWHRLQEARSRGEKVINAVVYEGGPAETLTMNLVLNRLRGKTKASEMVAVIKELTTTHGLDSDEIARRTGLSRDYIEQLWKISTAAPTVQEALDREVIGVGTAYHLSRLPAYAQQEEVMAQTQIWRWPVKDVRAKVDEVLAYMEQLKNQPRGTPPPEPPPPPKVYCQVCNRECAPEHLRGVLMDPECYAEVFRLVQARVQREAEARKDAPPP